MPAVGFHHVRPRGEHQHQLHFKRQFLWALQFLPRSSTLQFCLPFPGTPYSPGLFFSFIQSNVKVLPGPVPSYCGTSFLWPLIGQTCRFLCIKSVPPKQLSEIPQVSLVDEDVTASISSDQMLHLPPTKELYLQHSWGLLMLRSSIHIQHTNN